MRKALPTILLCLGICAGSFVGQYIGRASLRSQINGWAINHREHGWYFVYHEGLPVAMYPTKSEADNYITKHK